MPEMDISVSSHRQVQHPHFGPHEITRVDHFVFSVGPAVMVPASRQTSKFGLRRWPSNFMMTTVIELKGSVERVVAGNVFGCGRASIGSFRLPRWSLCNRVGFRPTAESGLRSLPSVLRDVVSLHGPGADAA